MKKFLAMTSVAIFLLTGCGSSSSSDTKSTPSKQEQVQQSKPAVAEKEPAWNTEDLDPTTSGNLEMAIITFRNKPDVQSSAVDAIAADVMRRPWDYYGQAVRFSGQVAVLQDYPPGHNISKALGGESCEIVMTADDGVTIIDGMLLGNTKGLQIGDYVTFCGYPCGILEVDNKIGGKFSHLVVVGRR